MRVNAFVSGGYLPESRRGKITNEMIHIADWYATFAAISLKTFNGVTRICTIHECMMKAYKG